VGTFFEWGVRSDPKMAWQARTQGKSPKGRSPQSWGRRETEEYELKRNWRKANDCSTPWETESSLVNPLHPPVEEAALNEVKKFNILKLSFFDQW